MDTNILYMKIQIALNIINIIKVSGYRYNKTFLIAYIVHSCLEEPIMCIII